MDTHIRDDEVIYIDDHHNKWYFDECGNICISGWGQNPDFRHGQSLLKDEDDVIRGPKFVIPEHLLARYSQFGHIPIDFKFYYSDTGDQIGKLVWRDNNKREGGGWSWCLSQVQRTIKERVNIYYGSDVHMPLAFQRHPISGKDVLVIGSATPLYEAFVFTFGGKPITIEYRKIEVLDNLPIKTYTIEESKEINVKGGAAVSISSIEHAGLGRYHDVLDPDADIKTVKYIRECLPPGGLFFLQIPIGNDLLVWNAGRTYGKLRLPFLLRGFKGKDLFGKGEPILVLEKTEDDKFCDAAFIGRVVANG